MTNQLATIQSTIIQPAKVAFNDDETFRREAEFAMQAFGKNKFLADTALKDPGSAIYAVKNIAAMKLSLNPASQLAYLIPRKGTVCLDISYKGLLKNAMDNGLCKTYFASLIYKNDNFKRNGLFGEPTFDPDELSEERGEIVGAFVTLKINDKDYYTEVMKKSEIDKIKKLSPSASRGSSPWVDFYDRMAIKTVVKRALNSPKGPFKEDFQKYNELMTGYMNNEAGEGIDFNKKPQIIEGDMTVEKSSEVENIMFLVEMAENEKELETLVPRIDTLSDEEKNQIKPIYKNTLKQLRG